MERYHIHSKDVVFHTIFGGDTASTLEMIHAMGQRAYSLTQSEHLRAGMAKALADGEGMGKDRMLALFFMLLNMDMPMKEYICNPSDKALFAAALNLSLKKNDVTKIDTMHCRCMMGTKALEPEKARRFYRTLRTAVCTWMATEILTPAHLVKEIREEYLAS